MARHKKSMTGRHLRIGDQIQRDLSEIINVELRDPRIGMITITEVQVSPDYTHAKVFFTTLQNDDQAAIQNILDGFAQATGFLRSQLGRRMSIRALPNLHFVHDDTMTRGITLSRLIEQANAMCAEDSVQCMANKLRHS